MEVSVDTTGPLERQLHVAVPEERIAPQVQSRLQSLSQTTKIDGFRPGKVPLKIVERRFGLQVRQEVVGEVLQQTFTEAMGQENLRPAGEPTIDPLSAEPGSGLSYTATFEVYPEISLSGLPDMAVTRLACDITDADIDNMIETLRRQHMEFKDVERAAATDDRLTIDFKGKVDGELFEGGSQDDFEIQLGSGRLLDGFEDGLVGASAGDSRDLELKFPDEYGREDLAGKPVQFEVLVKQVAEPVLPELDEQLFEKFGVSEGGVDAFRKEVSGNMGREKEDRLRERTKTNLMDALHQAVELEVPKALITNESMRMMQEMQRNLASQGMASEHLQNMQANMFEEQASRRVALGLIIAEIVKSNEITADATKVRERIETAASSYQDPDAVIKWYYQEPNRLVEVESSVLEDQAVEWVLQNAKITDEKIEFDALMKPVQTDND